MGCPGMCTVRCSCAARARPAVHPLLAAGRPLTYIGLSTCACTSSYAVTELEALSTLGLRERNSLTDGQLGCRPPEVCADTRRRLSGSNTRSPCAFPGPLLVTTGDLNTIQSLILGVV